MEECFKGVLPVNAVIVKVYKGGEKTSNSGRLVVIEEEKAVNFGKVVKLPHIVTDSSKEFSELLSSLSVGDEVIFNAKLTYNVISVEKCKEPNYEFLLVGLENIHAIIKRT